MFQNPMRIVGAYENNANESIEIDENVIYNLYFDTTRRLPWNYDNAEIGLYSMTSFLGFPLPKLIKNTTIQIKHKIISDLHEVTLDNISYVLKPGESLLFSIKLIPSEKPLTKLFTRDGIFIQGLKTVVNNFIDRRANNTNKPQLQELAILVQEVKLLAEDLNISKEDIGIVLDAILFTSFLYDSVSHPSSVSVLFTIPSENENTKVYYLHQGSIMDTFQPDNSTSSNVALTTEPAIWNGQTLGDRNKIRHNSF